MIPITSTPSRHFGNAATKAVQQARDKLDQSLAKLDSHTLPTTSGKLSAALLDWETRLDHAVKSCQSELEAVHDNLSHLQADWREHTSFAQECINHLKGNHPFQTTDKFSDLRQHVYNIRSGYNSGLLAANELEALRHKLESNLEITERKFRKFSDWIAKSDQATALSLMAKTAKLFGKVAGIDSLNPTVRLKYEVQSKALGDKFIKQRDTYRQKWLKPKAYAKLDKLDPQDIPITSFEDI